MHITTIKVSRALTSYQIYLSADYFGTRQTIFSNDQNAIGNHFLYRGRGKISCILLPTPPNIQKVHFYSIHVIAEYNVGFQNNLSTDIYIYKSQTYLIKELGFQMFYIAQINESYCNFNLQNMFKTGILVLVLRNRIVMILGTLCQSLPIHL